MGTVSIDKEHSFLHNAGEKAVAPYRVAGGYICLPLLVVENHADRKCTRKGYVLCAIAAEAIPACERGT
jgi:hypothetical protein